MRARSAALAAGGAGAFAAAVHLVPQTMALRAVRLRLSPALAGLGRTDHVALTFDDGPDLRSTPYFMEALDRLGWKATFFLLGDMVRKAPSLAGELVAAGHEVGLHGFAHDSHLWRPLWDSLDDLRRGRDTIQDAAGVDPVWFRPPYGSLSASALVAARRLEKRTILWTAWGRDWREKATPDTVVADVRKGLVPGATVLLHDSDCTSALGSWRSALGALPMLAEEFDRRSVTVGPLRDHGL